MPDSETGYQLKAWEEYSIKEVLYDPIPITDQDMVDIELFDEWLQRRVGKTKARWLFRQQRQLVSGLTLDDAAEKALFPEFDKYLAQFSSEIGFHWETKPKPKIQRKPGEPSIEFVARAAALVEVGEAARPELDIFEASRIALSQLDATTDEIHAFRNDPDYFIATIESRLALSAERIPDSKGQSRENFPSRFLVREVLQTIFELHACYATWSFMAGNLGNLFLLGFVIDSPHRLDTVEGLLDILEEFKDCDVLFIFETLQAATKFWGHILDKKLQTQLAASPLCSTKVTRVETKQILEQNWGYPQYRLEKTLSPTINTTELERKVLAFVVDDGIDEILAMYGAVTSATQTEKKQLDQVLFDSLGDHAMVHELRAALFDSTLGQTLARMDLKREHEENWIFDWTMLMKSWYNETCRLSRATRSTKYLPSLEHVRDPANFKAMWEYIDNGLAGYGWRSKDPYVRNLFGLFIPKDTTPPPPTRQPEPQIQQRPPSQSPSDPVVPTPSLLEVIDTQSRAMSGHAYMSSVDEESRTKGKSRPTSIHTPTQGRGPLDVNNVEEENAQKRNVFQLGRKIVKVFRRFLEDDNVEDPNLKKGQLRWNDFEKAMTKIGFRVKQTCGSSVRFDPPVDLKDSPSITFHKPHPDPVLTPGLIRRIGYRLHRRFGWKAGDFVIVDKTFQAPGDNE